MTWNFLINRMSQITVIEKKNQLIKCEINNVWRVMNVLSLSNSVLSNKNKLVQLFRILFFCKQDVYLSCSLKQNPNARNIDC